MTYYIDENGNKVPVNENEFANDKQSNYPSVAAPPTDTSENTQTFAESKQANYPGATAKAPVVGNPTPASPPANATPQSAQPTLSDDEKEFREQMMRVKPELRNMSEEEQNDYFSINSPEKYKSMQGLLEANKKEKERLENEKAQQEEDSKRIKRNARLAKAAALTAGLANLVTASTSRDGRNVAIPNPNKKFDSQLSTIEAKGNSLNAALQNNLERYNKIQGDMADLGTKARTYTYEQKAKRDKAARDADKAQAQLDKERAMADRYKALTEQAKQKTLNDAGKAELDKLKAYYTIQNLKLRGNALAADAKGKGEKNLYKIEYENGTKQFVIPIDKWTPTTIANAWSKVPEHLQTAALEALVETYSAEGDKQGEEEAIKILSATKSSNKNAIKTLDKNKLNLALGSIIDHEEAAPLRAFLTNIVNQGTGAKTSLGIVHSANGGTNSRETLQFK